MAKAKATKEETRIKVTEAAVAVSDILTQAGFSREDLTGGTLADALYLAQTAGKAAKDVTVLDVQKQLISWRLLTPSMWGYRFWGPKKSI
jgi:hypothetical protein